MNRRLRSDILHILALAVLYYVAGSLSQKLTVRGGLGAPVWPGAGIALAFLLARGNRMWIGVFLGALPTNLHLAMTASGSLGVAGIMLAGNAAVGATLQALAAARLVDGYVGFPRAMEEEGAAFRFVIIAGPLACCVSPTVGVTGLWLSGAISLSQYGLTWCTWWVGDSIGALVFAPLTLAWLPGVRGMLTRRRIAVTAPLCLLFAATVFLFSRADEWEDRRLRDQFDQQARQMADRVSASVASYTEIARAVAGLMELAPDVDRAGFSHFVDRFMYPGVQALSWAPRVTDADRATYEERARADGLVSFTFTERSDDGMVGAARRDEYFPVFYLDPLTGNEAAIGFDLGSSAARAAALERAHTTGQAAGTAPIVLVQETGSQYGFLVLAPAYVRSRDGNAATDELLGYASAVFRASDIVDAALLGEADPNVLFSIVDTSGGGPADLYRSDGADTGALVGLGEGPAYTRDIDMCGRAWRMAFAPSADFGDAMSGWQAWGVLTAGLLFTGFVGMTLLVMTGRTGRMEQIVEERTSQLVMSDTALRDRSAHLEAVHDAAADGIITVDGNGVIVSSSRPGGARGSRPTDRRVGSVARRCGSRRRYRCSMATRRHARRPDGRGSPASRSDRPPKRRRGVPHGARHDASRRGRPPDGAVHRA